jgi:hypothetical protein
MSRWKLSCPHCRIDISHTEISATVEALPLDPFLMWSALKPECTDGAVLDCPNCGKEFTYQRHELIYQSS